MKRSFAALLAGVGLAFASVPAIAAITIKTTISGYTNAGGFPTMVDPNPTPSGAIPYSLVFSQQIPPRNYDSVEFVDHINIADTQFQVTLIAGGREWNWFDLYAPGYNAIDKRTFYYWTGSEPLSSRDPLRNLQFDFSSAVEVNELGNASGLGVFGRTGVTGDIEMDNVFLPMTFIDWSSGYPSGEITFDDFEADVVGTYRLYVQCYYDGCPGALNRVIGGFGQIWTSDIRHVKVETLGAPVINPVPEPGTWALLIAGFGLIGAALRRRARGCAAI